MTTSFGLLEDSVSPSDCSAGTAEIVSSSLERFPNDWAEVRVRESDLVEYVSLGCASSKAGASDSASGSSAVADRCASDLKTLL